jgi:hypothetical protein
VLEALLGQPDLDIAAFQLNSRNVIHVRTALRSMRDKFFRYYVAVLSPDFTLDVMEQVNDVTGRRGGGWG